MSNGGNVWCEKFELPFHFEFDFINCFIYMQYVHNKTEKLIKFITMQNHYLYQFQNHISDLRMCDDQLDLADPPSLVPVGGKLLVEVGGEVLLCLTHKFIIFQRYLYIIGLHRILIWPDTRQIFLPDIRLNSNIEFFF